MTSYLDLRIGGGTPKFITAVIEIPQGGHEYDWKLHVFCLDRNLHSPVHYPETMGSSFPRPLLKTAKPLSSNTPIELALFEFGTKLVREGRIWRNINLEKLFSTGN
jgi:hypothetical protein